MKHEETAKERGASRVCIFSQADDIIVTANKRETLEEIKDILMDFLGRRGLTLSEEKTLITHIDDGFDFLGFNVRKYKGALLIKPSKKVGSDSPRSCTKSSSRGTKQ